ncbi:MAG: PilZ domain-containing protein [Deltaproteobacteria bacterium]|jgi:hypothetical protein|nr:PilZ domain-containing protein [Deltaproteobacteria bacterium]
MFRWLKLRKKRMSILRGVNLTAPLQAGLSVQLAEDAEQIMDSARLLHNSYLRRKIIQGSPGSMRLSLYSVLPSTAVVIARIGKQVLGTIQVHQRTETNLPIEETFDLSSIENGRLVEVGSLALHDSRAGKIEEVLLPMLAYVYQLCTRSVKADRIVIAVQPATEFFYEAVFGFKRVGNSPPKKHRYAANADAIPMWLDIHEFPKFMRSSYRKLPAKWNLEDFLMVNSDVFNVFKLPTAPEPGIHPKAAIVLEEIYVNRTPLLAQAPFEWRKNFSSLYPDTDEYRWLFKVDMDVAGRTARRYKVDEEIVLNDSFGLVRKGRLVDLSSGGMRVILIEKNVPPAIDEEIQVEIKLRQEQSIIVKTTLRRADLSDYSLGLRVIDPPQSYLDFVEDIRGTALGNSQFTKSMSTPGLKRSSKLSSAAAPSTGSFVGRDKPS